MLCSTRFHRCAAALALAVLLLGAGPVARAATCPSGRSLSALGFPHDFAAERGATRFHTVQSEGRTWIRARTDGAGTLGVARSARHAEEPVDLRGHFLKFRLRIRGEGRLGGMEFRIGSGGPWNDFYTFTIPLFGDPLFDPLQPGEWLPVTLSFGRAVATGNPDRRRIRWFSFAVRDDSSGAVQVDWADLSAVPLPAAGALSFTFDDGYDEHLEVAGRAMAKHGFAGTAYVMPDEVGDDGYMDLAALRTLDTWGWDIAAHHAVPFPDFNDAALAPTLAGVRDFLRAQGFGRGAGHLAYPLGRHDPRRIVPATRRVYQTARVAGAGPETLPPADRYRLRAVNVLGGTTTPEDLRDIALDAIEHRHWAVLMFHHLVPGTPANALEYREADFVRGVELIRETGVAVRTVSDVWRDWECDANSLPRSVPASP